MSPNHLLLIPHSLLDSVNDTGDALQLASALTRGRPTEVWRQKQQDAT